jgi:hypothetical protein
LLHPGPVDPADAPKRRSFSERLVRFANLAVESGQTGLAERLLNRALERALASTTTPSLAANCWTILLAIQKRG